MNLKDVTNVLCLSCVLMFVYVSSLESCPPGWFGTQCKYKCRCDKDNCDVDGSCTGSYHCQGGWFGPACQYADLAYLTPTSPVLTDADENTCNDASSGDTARIVLNYTIVFSWLRVCITTQGIDTLSQLSVSFSRRKIAVSCPALRKADMDKTTQDMHCDLSRGISEVTLTGEVVPHLCSVYVSGGRNVALKESASQESTFIANVSGVPVSLGADKAVDGNRSQDLYKYSCAHTTNSTSWTVRFSSHRSVTRYVIFNRLDHSSFRLRGFSMEGFDAMNVTVFAFTDQSVQAKDNYSITHQPKPVQALTVTFNASATDILTLCEVEVYGDSICDPQHYGRDCEHPCNCSDNEACFVSTGGCPSGCPAGFYGIGCMNRCGAGRFGPYCNLSCSENCGPSSQVSAPRCDNVGVCQTECRSGTMGPYCENKCSVGKFGINCNASCSPNCEPSGQANVTSCDSKTGDCHKGCQSGFSGALCREAVPATTRYLKEIIVGLCALVAIIFFLIYCCCKRRMSRPTPEKTKDIANCAEEDATQ